MTTVKIAPMLAKTVTMAVSIAWFTDACARMFPWLIACIPLILLDLRYGVKAARYRHELVRFSKGLRATVGKVFEYLCWISVSVLLAHTFGEEWIEPLVLALVILNEFSSIIGNYFETKGYKWNQTAVWKAIAKKGADAVKLDLETNDLITKKEEEKDNGES